MSPQSIVCTTCDAAVPYGRLSCPECGELLASVAGAARPAKARTATARAARGRTTQRATPSVLVDVPAQAAEAQPAEAQPAEAQPAEAQPEEAQPAGAPPQPAAWTPGSPDVVQDRTSTSALGWDVAAWDMHEPEVERFDDEPDPDAPDAPAWQHDASGWEPPIFQSIPEPDIADAPLAAGAATDVARAPTNGTAHDFPNVAWPADQAPRVPAPGVASPSPVASPPPGTSQTAPPPVARPPAPPPYIPDAPGAYVPPIVHAEPAGAPAPARAWAGRSAADLDAEKAGGSRTSMTGDLLDAARVTEFVGWLAVAGSAMAAVGFLLPWGMSVIGASGVGYFDRWGLAGPFHLIVFASLLALLGLSLVRNPIPLWLRVGVLGLGLGALLLGLTWPYLVALSGTGPGAMVVAVGALVLVAAGVVALATDRHAHEDRAV